MLCSPGPVTHLKTRTEVAWVLLVAVCRRMDRPRVGRLACSHQGDYILQGESRRRRGWWWDESLRHIRYMWSKHLRDLRCHMLWGR